jgi:branched-subunit amino acid transport protein
VNLWLIIILSGLTTYGIRLSFIAAHGRVAMPLWATRALTFVPMAVLSAIILPEVVVRNELVDLSAGNPRWIAALLAVLVAWRTKNVWLTIAIGMLALYALQAIL